MSVLNQKTLKNSFEVVGIGLHSGKPVKMNVYPSEPNTGIVFKRIDLSNNNFVIPNVFNVSNATFCTTISNEFGVKISTLEHFMAALFGKGIDNALIEIDNEEVPILDGSAKQFIKAIDEAGIKISDSPIKVIKIEKEIVLEDENKKISIEPSKISLDIDFEIKYDNSLIGTQRNVVKVYESDLEDIMKNKSYNRSNYNSIHNYTINKILADDQLKALLNQLLILLLYLLYDSSLYILLYHQQLLLI